MVHCSIALTFLLENGTTMMKMPVLANGQRSIGCFDVDL